MHSYHDIQRLVSILSSLRDPYNHHGERVAEYAMKLAMELKLPSQHVELIGVGAHLHDIGKLLINADLLNLPRKLSPVERHEMERHTTLGWQAVTEAGYDIIVCNIVRQHHEHWDGKGYPDRLTGKGISMGAQIVGLCDAYDALTSTRAYREAFSHNYAMAAIQKEIGSTFERSLVDLFFTRVAASRN